MSMEKNFYDVLGVKKTATKDEIKKAYRELCKKYHPDKHGGDDTKIKEVNEAYAILGDDEKRKQYDAQASGFGGFDGFGNGGFNFNFRQLAQDVYMTITISIEDAYNGCKYPVTSNGRVYTIDIPKGVTDRKILRIPGLGKSGFNIYGQKATGDLIVTVKIQNTDKMYLTSMTNGNTILEVLQGIDWIDAILGGEITIKVFDRDVKVRIPKYSQNGGYTMVGGQGYHKYNSDELGTLRVNFLIRMPKSLTDEQIEQLKKIKESL